MPVNKMLIDSTHPEETRVVVLKGGRVEEFDFESAARKLLRGNIYLAKVTRVEPSLQAAFIDYGGNRHGFLAFNEIHPDYYQIPVADRQALLQEEAAQEAAEEAEADAAAVDAPSEPSEAGERHAVDVSDLLPPEPSSHSASDAPHTMAADAQPDDRTTAEPSSYSSDHSHSAADAGHAGNGNGYGARGGEAASGDEIAPGADVNVVETVDAAATAAPEQVENAGNEDALEELPSRPRRRRRSYKIQEVIKRRQIILVQVVKEERGTKGAALTTYLSLAGRYTVLMPNTARGGGISRKITNAQDRKRLKAIADELEVPEGMGLIIRTAGAARTKQEIKRDFEYLLRLWESVRDMTLQSTAPSLVYEEGNLIKRSIRDLYTKDVEEIIVAGGDAHVEARDFMRMLMPSHAKNVIAYEESEPLFTRFQIERQLNAMFSPYVYLRSGGYLVINQTEALVAVDVNSGKSTREFSIEETALNTNLEAADEIARQLKLRDLAGLIVIDFIDMEEKRNNRQVERRLKEALRFDRARIQVGHISHFGLLEMSRQRLRTGVLEGSTTQCPHCQGTGIIRSVESVALAVIRGLEDALMTGQPASLTATTTAPVALYILNNKRQFILDMEARHGITVTVQASDKLQGANFTIERGAAPTQAPRRPERSTAVSMDWGFNGESDNEPSGEPDIEEIEPESGSPDVESDGEGEGHGDSGRGRRRRRKRGRRDDRPMRGAESGGDRGERGERGGHRDRDTDRNRERPRPAASYAGGGEQPDTGDAPLATHDQPREAGMDLADNADGEPGGHHIPAREDTGEEGEGRRGRRGRRRGRRGGRRGRENGNGLAGAAGETAGYGEGGPAGHLDAPAGGERDWQSPHEAGGAEGHAAPAPWQSHTDEHDPPRPLRVSDPAEPTAHRSTSAPPAPVTAPSSPPSRPEPEPQPPIAADSVPVAPRVTPPASAPHIERVVVRPDAAPMTEAPATAPADEAAKPARKGWWQRRFSGE